MTDTFYRRAIILGCGSSGGVPRIGGDDGQGDWGDCDPSNPKNRRLRCSLYLEQSTTPDFSEEKTTRILVDTTPDMRAQLLHNRIRTLDAVLYTHDHADHTHGLDDLRPVVFNIKRILPVWADKITGKTLMQRFSYAFEQPVNSAYTPILSLHLLEAGKQIHVHGPGGTINVLPLEVDHGRIKALGFRFDNLAYIPDVSFISNTVLSQLGKLEYFIIDALQYKPHPTHANLEQALAWIKQVKPAQAILTNMHIDMDHAKLCDKTDTFIHPAFDNMVVNHLLMIEK